LMIQAMINSIQKEYLMEDQSQKFGYNVQRFIDETNPFGNNSVEYMGHNLSFTEQDYDEFLMDVYSYSTSILSELQQRFPNRSLFTSMKILNPQEWPKNSQDLLFFGDDELENLLEQEWAGFKLVVSNNLSSKDIDIILPLLIQDYNDTFPNIIKLIQLVYCIPFSSVECECGFSRQNQIKTKSRNFLTTDTLDRLMCISLEGLESSKFNYNRAYTIWSNQRDILALRNNS
ncbi:14104_t:CDS:2, partial [Rhizophagus irregularis]